MKTTDTQQRNVAGATQTDKPPQHDHLAVKLEIWKAQQLTIWRNILGRNQWSKIWTILTDFSRIGSSRGRKRDWEGERQRNREILPLPPSSPSVTVKSNRQVTTNLAPINGHRRTRMLRTMTPDRTTSTSTSNRLITVTERFVNKKKTRGDQKTKSGKGRRRIDREERGGKRGGGEKTTSAAASSRLWLLILHVNLITILSIISLKKIFSQYYIKKIDPGPTMQAPIPNTYAYRVEVTTFN